MHTHVQIQTQVVIYYFFSVPFRVHSISRRQHGPCSVFGSTHTILGPLLLRLELHIKFWTRSHSNNMVPHGHVYIKFGDIEVSIFSDVVRLGVLETLLSRHNIFKVLDLISVLKFRVLVSASVAECLPHLLRRRLFPLSV